MNRIGFDVSSEDEHEIQVGEADSIRAEYWTDDLPEYFFNSWTRFCLVYGMFAAIRDLIRSIF